MPFPSFNITMNSSEGETLTPEQQQQQQLLKDMQTLKLWKLPYFNGDEPSLKVVGYKNT